jgi:hypothetical protein
MHAVLLVLPGLLQAPPSLDTAFDEPLDTPFLRPIGAISRPGSSSSGQSNPSTVKTPSPIRASNGYSCSIYGPPLTTCADPQEPDTASNSSGSRTGSAVPQPSPAASTAQPIKRVSWLDCGAGPNTGSKACFGSMHSMTAAGQASAQHDSSIWSSGGLLSVKSAPAGSFASAGDLRDQGRISCSGGGRIDHPQEEPCTPLQVRGV